MRLANTTALLYCLLHGILRWFRWWQTKIAKRWFEASLTYTQTSCDSPPYEHWKKRPTKKITNPFRPPETDFGRRQGRLARPQNLILPTCGSDAKDFRLQRAEASNSAHELLMHWLRRWFSLGQWTNWHGGIVEREECGKVKHAFGKCCVSMWIAYCLRAFYFRDLHGNGL